MPTTPHPTGTRRALALALLLATVAAMLSPLLMLAQPHAAASPAIDAGAGSVGAAGSAADHWAPVISSALVQLGGIFAHRKALSRLRARVVVLERAFRSLTGAEPRTLVPAVPADALPARGAA